MALRPELVRADRIATGATEPLAALAPRLRADGVRAVSPNGVLGDPLGASAAEGGELFAMLTDQLVAAVDGWLADRVRR
jgi:creatinine amidohydrolase